MSSADSLPPPLQTDSPELKAPPVVASGQSRVDIDSTPVLRSVPKTSISHPINISWIIPNEYCPLLSLCDLPDDIDLYDLTDAVLQSEYVPKLIMACQATPDRPLARPMGNLALSSCPGKKVRLTGPSRGRAAINRDLDLDFGRMRSLGITTLVCCLNDTELDFLGASWPKYCESATRNGMQVIRLPMIEGGCPNSIEEIDAVIQAVNVKIRQGENVLAHCRGGVGRAGVFACCWLLKNLYCLSGERSIRYVRTRRSAKAIETMRQAEFIIHYSQYISHTLEQRQQQQLYHLHYNDAQKDRQEQEHTINSNININMNNFDYPVNNHESSTAIATTWTPLELLNTDYTISVPSIIDIMFLEQSIRETDHRPHFPYYYHQPPQQSDNDGYDPLTPKGSFYNELLEETQAIVEGQKNWVTNLANASAVIYHGLRSLQHFQEKPINWAGFYITDKNDSNKLILGPFQGKVACTEIPLGKGVCGTAAQLMQTQVIKDVHAFPGHIACDSASNSEIVVPMVLDGRVIGVLDIDCEKVEGFSEEDRIGLEAIVEVLVKSSEWNQ